MTPLIELGCTCLAALRQASSTRDLGAFKDLGVGCGWGYGQKAGSQEGGEPHDGLDVAVKCSNKAVE